MWTDAYSRDGHWSFFFFFTAAGMKTRSSVHHLVMAFEVQARSGRLKTGGAIWHLIVCLQDLRPNSPVAYRTCPGSGCNQEGERERRHGALRCSEAANTIWLFLAVVGEDEQRQREEEGGSDRRRRAEQRGVFLPSPPPYRQSWSCELG